MEKMIETKAIVEGIMEKGNFEQLYKAVSEEEKKSKESTKENKEKQRENVRKIFLCSLLSHYRIYNLVFYKQHQYLHQRLQTFGSLPTILFTTFTHQHKYHQQQYSGNHNTCCCFCNTQIDRRYFITFSIQQYVVVFIYDLPGLLVSEKITHVGGMFQVDLTFLIYWAILLLLSYVFRYGEQLQQLSDETL